MGEQKHHLYSPSSMERRYLCPASAKAEKDMPEFTSDAAESGTRIHEQASLLINQLANGEIKVEPLADVAEQEKAESIRDFFLREKIAMDGTTVFLTEHKVTYGTPMVHELFNGTVDAIMKREDGSVDIFDWKTGMNPVDEADSNWQGAMYAIAAMQGCLATEARVVFYNPTIKQTTRAEFNVGDMKLIEERVIDVIGKCEPEDAPCVAGLKQCRYCKAALGGTCAAFREWMARQTAVPKTSISDMDDATLAQEYERVTSPVKKYADALKAEMLRRAKENGTCGGYEIKVREGARQITDLQGLYNAIQEIVPYDEFVRICKVPVTALLNLYGDKYRKLQPDIQAKEIKGFFGDVSEPFMGRGESTETLVKIKGA